MANPEQLQEQRTRCSIIEELLEDGSYCMCCTPSNTIFPQNIWKP